MESLQTGKPPPGLHFKLRLVLFHDSKFSQPCHMYLPISRRWQEITWLLPCLSRAKHYTSLSYIGFKVTLDKDWITNAASVCIQHLNLMQQYICNNNTLIAFQKLGGLICSGACLSQSYTDGDPSTQRWPRLDLHPVFISNYDRFFSTIANIANRAICISL